MVKPEYRGVVIKESLWNIEEECNVLGEIIKKTSEYVDPYDDNNFFYTFHIDIGNQTPSLGYDPEEEEEGPVLAGVRWMSLDEISEIDRAFLWVLGLVSIAQFTDELETWNREISHPGRRTSLKKQKT